jgi:hypothetical protein
MACLITHLSQDINEGLWPDLEGVQITERHSCCLLFGYGLTVAAPRLRLQDKQATYLMFGSNACMTVWRVLSILRLHMSVSASDRW